MAGSIQQAQQTTDAAIGAGATVLGWLGFLYQAATDAANDLILWGNVVLVVGGLYLMWPKIKRRWKESRRKDADG